MKIKSLKMIRISINLIHKKLAKMINLFQFKIRKRLTYLD